MDVQHPQVNQVLAELPSQTPAIVVPLLLSGGYHTHVDIAQATADRENTQAASCLGPDDRLIALLHQRIVEASGRAGDAVVLAAAGSSDSRSIADVEMVATRLADRWPGPVSVGFGSIASPSVAEAVAAARADAAAAPTTHLSTGRVIVAAYLLAPGHFLDRLAQAGADAVTAPLAPDPVLAGIALDRYDAVARIWSGNASR